MGDFIYFSLKIKYKEKHFHTNQIIQNFKYCIPSPEGAQGDFR